MARLGGGGRGDLADSRDPAGGGPGPNEYCTASWTTVRARCTSPKSSSVRARKILASIDTQGATVVSMEMRNDACFAAALCCPAVSPAWGAVAGIDGEAHSLCRAFADADLVDQRGTLVDEEVRAVRRRPHRPLERHVGPGRVRGSQEAVRRVSRPHPVSGAPRPPSLDVERRALEIPGDRSKRTPETRSSS